MKAALRTFRQWQTEAEATLEALDAPFRDLKEELVGLYAMEGVRMEDEVTGWLAV